MNRGHRGTTLFRNDTDRRRFLGLVAGVAGTVCPRGPRLRADGQSLSPLLVRTGEANLSHAVRWLNVGYAVKFNWAHRCRGTVFQGRFKSVLIQEERGVVEVARYLHLNPVRIGGLGVSKSDQRRARMVGGEDPGRALVNERLRVLREYRWSSWRVYGGADPAPEWLETGLIGRACGGRSRVERRGALRAYTEEPIRQGRLENPWEGLVGGVVLGEVEYARGLMAGRKVNEEEQTEARRMRRRVSWEEVVRATETVRGGKWDEWAERHGDLSRDGAMYVAVRHGGLSLAEVVREVEGLRYQAAAQAVKRFGEAVTKDSERRRFVLRLRRQLSIL